MCPLQLKLSKQYPKLLWLSSFTTPGRLFPNLFFSWPWPYCKLVGRVYSSKRPLGADDKWSVVDFGKYISHSTTVLTETVGTASPKLKIIRVPSLYTSSCHSGAVSCWISEEPHWVEVLTEVLLSLLTRPSSLFRHVVDQVFTILAPHLTRNALIMILEVRAWFFFFFLSESMKCLAVFVVVFGQSTCGDQSHPQANQLYDNRCKVHPNHG